MMSEQQKTLEELALRCEREEPSFVLDCEIGAAIYNIEAPGVVVLQDGIWTINLHGSPLNPIWRPFKPLNYTTSLDAAVTLVPDGHVWRAGAGVNGYADVGRRGIGFVDREGQPFPDHTWAKTAALALCAAALRARADLTKYSD